MARQSRQQRRARRTQGQPALAGVPPTPPPAPPRPTASGGDEPARRPQRAEVQGPHSRRYPGSKTIHFIQESWGELRKVEWPSQRGVVSGTAVVLIACTIVGTYLWLNDKLWQYVVHHVLLR
jgi:preprotein translocase SecE subunit